MPAKISAIAAGLAITAMAAIQFVRPERTNPPSDPAASFTAVVKPPHEVDTSLTRACYDCHSNHTVWPWYSRIAPVSWLVARDVNQGRAHLNLSEWAQPGHEGEKPEIGGLCEQVSADKMPPRSYLLMHPSAKLSHREAAVLCSLSPGTKAEGD